MKILTKWSAAEVKRTPLLKINRLWRRYAEYYHGPMSRDSRIRVIPFMHVSGQVIGAVRKEELEEELLQSEDNFKAVSQLLQNAAYLRSQFWAGQLGLPYWLAELGNALFANHDYKAAIWYKLQGYSYRTDGGQGATKWLTSHWLKIAKQLWAANLSPQHFVVYLQFSTMASGNAVSYMSVGNADRCIQERECFASLLSSSLQQEYAVRASEFRNAVIMRNAIAKTAPQEVWTEWINSPQVRLTCPIALLATAADNDLFGFVPNWLKIVAALRYELHLEIVDKTFASHPTVLSQLKATLQELLPTISELRQKAIQKTVQQLESL